MAYRNKTYVCFDADTDMKWYQLMKAWKENQAMNFDFDNAHEINNLRDGSSEETIKRKLRERLESTKTLVVLIGKNTRNLYKYVRWEIEYAIEKDIPIVAINLNDKKSIDHELCPPILQEKLAIHIPYEQKIIYYALNHWPSGHTSHKTKNEIEPFRYLDSVYNSL